MLFYLKIRFFKEFAVLTGAQSEKVLRCEQPDAIVKDVTELLVILS
jgi:hypothetical protein